MAKEVNVEVFSDAPNASVIRLPWRKYPGLVLQGDSLKILRDDVEALRECARHVANAEELVEGLSDLESKLVAYLREYESALKAGGLKLPYSSAE